MDDTAPTPAPILLRRRAVALVAVLAALLAIWQLESARSGVEIESFRVGETPVTRYAEPGADGPLVVVAHGFAGSRQMMQAYSLALAQAGYVAWAFDFEGHGRNPVPMSGDVDSIDGTTQLLIDQTLSVVESGLSREAWEGEVALLGHSMATDIIIRTALRDGRVGPVVAISPFSQAVTAEAPERLLMITGEWEPGLRDFALRALRMVDSDADEGETARAGEVVRRAVVAPLAEHVAVLYSKPGRAEAVAWLDAAYDRESAVSVPRTGPWFLVLFVAVVALAWPLSHLLPARRVEREPLALGPFLLLLLVPAVMSPYIATAFSPEILPVLVADYLALHLLLYGVVQLSGLARYGVPLGRVSPLAGGALILWGLVVFGFLLDRYGANFWPTAERGWIILALAVGAVPFMLADALITMGGRAPFWQRIAARVAFFASLGLAVALDFEGLFFLLLIAPVILLFYLLYGLMGRWAARAGGAAGPGLALGLILAWALGVSFPLFAG
ncbi:alpha/beta hydrolase [Rhodosalinus halophilus]|uniref:Alpha/beta hydrolase n=1 Tax=Rhodosalinus halophilus TaxID=2259333 RepID=A0A365U9N6_9RHOB|nr:alpha/beta hydrolase [Rhodosalinus halophilus]RBI85752.1 alpha/beta hydrolase [Rhodosalinus halophilus]